MENEARLSPEAKEVIERGLRARADRPAVPGGDGSASFGPEFDEEDLERRTMLAGAARLGMVPMLVDGDEWFKHKDGLVPEDLTFVAAWHDAEAGTWEARAERARFACEVLDGLEDLDQAPATGGRPVRGVLALLARLVGRLRLL